MLYLFEDFGLDTDRRELHRAASPISIEPKVFDLLVYAIRNRERVISKEDLIAAIWNGRIVSESALTTCINAARNAIGDSGESQRLIKTLPRKGIRFVGTVTEKAMKPSSALPADLAPALLTNATAANPGAAIVDGKPSVAVLRFTNLSDDPDQRYFSDGITEDIVTELSRYRSLFAISHPVDLDGARHKLEVRYIVEGSVRRVQERLRVTVQLVDAATGAHLWAERYDREVQDVFAVQEEIARTIAATLEGRVAASDIARAKRKPTWDLVAYDYFLRGRERDAYFDLVAAETFFARATELDPGYVHAHAYRANALTVLYWLEQDPDRLRRAEACARTALSLDDHDASSHEALGYVALHQRKFDLARIHLDRAASSTRTTSPSRGVVPTG